MIDFDTVSNLAKKHGYTLTVNKSHRGYLLKDVTIGFKEFYVSLAEVVSKLDSSDRKQSL